MDWIDEYNQMICELMAQQVRKGNRWNTHLSTLGYAKVSVMFFQMIRIELTKDDSCGNYGTS
jgi:hypothetical protein